MPDCWSPTTHSFWFSRSWGEVQFSFLTNFSMMLILLVWWSHFENHCLRKSLASYIQSIRKGWLYIQNYAESDHNLVQATITSCLHYNSLLTYLPAPTLALLETSVNIAVRMILPKHTADHVSFLLQLCKCSPLHSD